MTCLRRHLLPQAYPAHPEVEDVVDAVVAVVIPPGPSEVRLSLESFGATPTQADSN